MLAFGPPSGENFNHLVREPLYLRAAANSVTLAGGAAFMAVATAWPLALAIFWLKEPIRSIAVSAVVLPFWTSYLLRIYAWIVLLDARGPLSGFLPVSGLFRTDFAAQLGIAYSYLPFAFLPIMATIYRVDPRIVEAAFDLGATPLRALWRIVAPLSLPGVLVGFFLVFVPVLGELIAPELLGGPSTLTLGRVLWIEFFDNRDIGAAAALAFTAAGAVAIVGTVFMILRRREDDNAAV